MIKAIFFDIDGTLLSHQSSSVPSSAKSAITRLREKGIKLFTATGRHMKEIPILTIEADRMYINFINSPVRAAQKAISTPLPDIGTHMGNKVYQYIVFGDKQHVNTLTEQLSCRTIPVSA